MNALKLSASVPWALSDAQLRTIKKVLESRFAGFKIELERKKGVRIAADHKLVGPNADALGGTEDNPSFGYDATLTAFIGELEKLVRNAEAELYQHKDPPSGSHRVVRPPWV